MATTKQVLEIARRRIEAGWVKGTLGAFNQRTGPVCLIGGLFAGLHELGLLSDEGDYRSETAKDLRIEAERLLVECLPGTWNSVAGFNDASGTTQERVIGVLNCAIKRAPDRPSVVVG